MQLAAALVAALLLLMVPARADDPAGIALNQDWIGLGIAYDHLRQSMSAYVGKVQADAVKAQADAVDAERLKWLLDHPEWLGAPAAKK